MPSPCIREASTCFHRFFMNPSLDKLDSESSATTTTATSNHDFTNSTISSLYPYTHFTNHESLPSQAELFSNFTKAYPQYLKTYLADQIRAQEYYHLLNHVCLDYTGNGLFSYSHQHIHYSATLTASTSTSAPPTLHSNSSSVPFFHISNKPANLYSWLHYGGQESELDSIIRKRITSFMNISEDEYSMVFTANQSSAYKLLADNYPFHSNRDLLTVYDFVNEAVEILIDCSKKKGAQVMSAEFSWPKMSIHSRNLRKMVTSKRKNKRRGLFVFPLQSRMTGARYSYQWLRKAQENGWHILLDSTASGAKDMETLGLSFFRPDFLYCSFYKIFGENPSGFGCLFVKKSTAVVFESLTSTSIGIVSLLPATRHGQFFDKSSSFDIDTEQQPSPSEPNRDNLALSSSSCSSLSVQQDEKVVELEKLKEAKEKQEQEISSEITELDNSLNINQLGNRDVRSSGYSDIEFRGLDHADSLGLILIRSRARYLVNWLINAMMSLQHPHSEFGLPLVKIYGPRVRVDRGPALAFNLFDWKGEKVDPELVQKLADRNNISLGLGVLKNIRFSDKHEDKNTLLHTRTPEHTKFLKNKKDKSNISISVSTASFGMLTNFEDTYRLWAFASKFLDADFVEKERWRYTALNQRAIEV
ncbi:Molybdenum cofactor sulfurase [Heracleum sosnowskyi]|uniref:Molybdenum cofactor sulfurase n=1 Tax=Heracleum sosnowskyi TaxID=360622 RepID=A0AAD8MJV3_9APIA|nr:Molybdenum cofactor sulfurase [Heracleum sosnowskyi]